MRHEMVLKELLRLVPLQAAHAAMPSNGVLGPTQPSQHVALPVRKG
jgi:hypothetical protein